VATARLTTANLKDPANWTTYTVAHGLPDDRVTALAVSGADIWAGTPSDSTPRPVRFALRAQPEPVGVGTWYFRSAGQPGAVRGIHEVMVGGDREIFERVKPILASFGDQVLYTGELGAASICKLAHQILYLLGACHLRQAIDASSTRRKLHKCSSCHSFSGLSARVRKRENDELAPLRQTLLSHLFICAPAVIRP